ncbi:MAG: hypothetical protein F9K42_00750 [Ignavibacterium sp.]|nr:MAG: hypothetical protein F9K42_00750 [Ignavibacterium sp.]
MKFLITILVLIISTHNNLIAQKQAILVKITKLGPEINLEKKPLLGLHGEKTSDFKYDVELPQSNNRNGYTYIAIGLAEIVSVGVGLQINEDYALGIKYGGCWIAKGFRYGAGFGLKLSRSLSSKYFNNINLELTTYTSSSVQFTESFLIKGAAIDFNIGNESKFNAINFIWSVGFITSIAKVAQPLFVPSMKIGFNINF